MVDLESTIPSFLFFSFLFFSFPFLFFRLVFLLIFPFPSHPFFSSNFPSEVFDSPVSILFQAPSICPIGAAHLRSDCSKMHGGFGRGLFSLSKGFHITCSEPSQPGRSQFQDYFMSQIAAHACIAVFGSNFHCVIAYFVCIGRLHHAQ